MREMFYLLLALVAMSSCSKNPDTYTIRVDLEGSEGKWVKLMAMEDRNYITFDSVLVETSAPSVMSKAVEGINTMYLSVEGEQESLKLLIENRSYDISGSLEDPVISSGSKAQNDLNDYNKKIGPVTGQMAELVAKLRSGDNATRRDSLLGAYYALNDKKSAIDSAYIAENPSSFASVLALRGTFYMLDIDGLEAALTGLDTPLHQMEEYSYMYGKLERMKAVDIGQSYTDFGLPTPDGGSLKVSDVHKGNVMLIDFWASWCGPCRRANPEVVAIYSDYRDKGFEILGVSLDRDAASWQKAIEDDNLTWPHISDLKYWNSEGAELYGVPAIPHTVLIDREGRIIAKNL
ncbi:MAG: TlpA disulfide reductase family protein, partial [Bacteroidota bacterium]